MDNIIVQRPVALISISVFHLATFCKATQHSILKWHLQSHLKFMECQYNHIIYLILATYFGPRRSFSGNG
jgi:hypothetical protein